MYYNLLTNFLGGLVFLFLLWKKIREDYSSQLVFSLGFLTLIGIAIGALLSRIFFPSWWFWFCFTGILTSASVCIYRFKMKTFEIIDALTFAFFPWLVLVFLADSVTNQSVFSLGAFFILLAIYLLYRFVDSRYKRFSWYKSGRVGFSSLFALSLFFVLRAGAGLVAPNMLSFAGRADVYVSAVLSFFVFFGMFHLARKA